MRMMKRLANVASATAIGLTALTAFQMSEAKATTFSWEFQGIFTSIEQGNDFIYLGDSISGSGSLTASNISGSQYLVTAITGTAYLNYDISQPHPLSGPLALLSFYNNDNNLDFLFP